VRHPEIQPTPKPDPPASYKIVYNIEKVDLKTSLNVGEVRVKNTRRSDCLHSRISDGGKMATVFISHSSQDDAFAKQLSEDLKLIGYTPWIDDLEIRPGESIISAIQDGITRSRYMVVVLSTAAVQSGWVDTEWKEKFWDVAMTQKIGVVPVLRNKCTVPLFLRSLRYADFTASYAVGFATLCLTLRPTSSVVPNILDRDFLRAIEDSAKSDERDHVRLACAHTVWSCRPDRAKPILEDALHDLRDIVRIHAQVLLDQFY
jgi:hypothetical protein